MTNARAKDIQAAMKRTGGGSSNAWGICRVSRREYKRIYGEVISDSLWEFALALTISFLTVFCVVILPAIFVCKSHVGQE